MIRLVLEEYLDEMTTLCKDYQNDVSIVVNPNSNRQGNPYFKFYNSTNYSTADKVVRILFNYADYVIHTNTDGKKLWKLSHKEKRILNELLNKPSTKYSNMTVWEACKFEWNTEYLELPINLDKYINGEYDKDVHYTKNAGYVPYSLSMPNYMNIEF